MARLRAPGAPVTSASPIVIMTASTLPAANASIDGAYSNQSNFTSIPASLNHPFWIPISNAVQPGQSLKATRSGVLAGAGAVEAAALALALVLALAEGDAVSGAGLVQPPSAQTNTKETKALTIREV